MYQHKFTLKQHTPIIHFQHEQEGASLRASEVKPKLDRFIILKCGGKDKMEKSWFNDFEKGSLAYKLALNTNNITPNINEVIKKDDRNAISLFFGNMGEDYSGNEKALIYADGEIENSILCKSSSLKNEIDKYLPLFFLLNNFGTRNSKGFGSYTVKQDDSNLASSQIAENFLFNFSLQADSKINLDSFKTLFEQVNWFYKSLRSGLNEIRGRDNYPKLYFKSLLYQYVNDSLNAQWDKKTIKQHFLAGVQSKECEKYEDDIVCSPNSQKNERNLVLKNYRDLLGLSSKEMWGRNFTLSKSEAEFDTVQRKWKKKSDSISVVRYKSPLLFKIIRIENEYKVYLSINHTKEYADYLNTVFWVENGKGLGFPIAFPDNFNFIDFLNYSFSKIKIEDRFVIEGHHSSFVTIKKSLINIYSQLHKQVQL